MTYTIKKEEPTLDASINDCNIYIKQSNVFNKNDNCLVEENEIFKEEEDLISNIQKKKDLIRNRLINLQI